MNILKNMLLCSILMLSICHTGSQVAYSGRRDFFCPNKTLMWGAIQFPKSIAIIPDIRIYYSGQRIKCEINHELKRITYAIPDVAHKTFFKLLITDDLEFVSECNVIKYLKVSEGAPYKFYQINLAPCMNHLCSLEQSGESETSSQTPSLAWDIREHRNALFQGRIPDDTIIICCKSSFIDHLEGTNANALPTVKIRPDIVEFAGSEKKLHEISDELILSLLDYDTIHAAMHQEEIRPSASPKTILAITT